MYFEMHKMNMYFLSIEFSTKLHIIHLALNLLGFDNKRFIVVFIFYKSNWYAHIQHLSLIDYRFMKWHELSTPVGL